MDMKIHARKIVELRNKRAWSQQHLARVSGLSLRTIQRVENTQKASQETVQSIAAVFEIAPHELLETEAEHSNQKLSVGVTKIKSFLACAAAALLYVLLNAQVSYAGGIEISAIEAFAEEDSLSTYRGDVVIVIPDENPVEIAATESWQTGNAVVFSGNVVVRTATLTISLDEAIMHSNKGEMVISAEKASVLSQDPSG